MARLYNRATGTAFSSSDGFGSITAEGGEAVGHDDFDEVNFVG